jgi:hypothetical protein
MLPDPAHASERDRQPCRFGPPRRTWPRPVGRSGGEIHHGWHPCLPLAQACRDLDENAAARSLDDRSMPTRPPASADACERLVLDSHTGPVKGMVRGRAGVGLRSASCRPQYIEPAAAPQTARDATRMRDCAERDFGRWRSPSWCVLANRRRACGNSAMDKNGSARRAVEEEAWRYRQYRHACAACSGLRSGLSPRPLR